MIKEHGPMPLSVTRRKVGALLSTATVNPFRSTRASSISSSVGPDGAALSHGQVSLPADFGFLAAGFGRGCLVAVNAESSPR